MQQDPPSQRPLLQQSESISQKAPICLQQTPAGQSTPDPPQQSKLELQVPPSALQHVPPEQVLPPQQSELKLHCSPAATQHVPSSH
jgi:hypothetical protein